MGRRGVPRTLTDRAPLTPGRELAHSVTDSARDVLHPVITIGRGLRSLAAAGRRGWARTPRDRRGAALLLAASCMLIVALIPYGPPLAAAALLAAGAWRGRDRATAPTARQDPVEGRLQALYEALVPYFSSPLDPTPLYSHGGVWRQAFDDHAFDDEGRLVALRLRYPAYFTDGESEARARIEHLLQTKAGRGREYRFVWDEEEGVLDLSVLPALPVGIRAQRFVTAPGEVLLGFTDPEAVQRTLPVTDGNGTRDVPPVIWRTGQRSSEPHLLALGRPASGVTTLLRSVLLQALHHGDVVIVDGGGAGEYACLAGREGVLAVESAPPGATAALEWAAQETQRRLVATNTARQQGRPAPEDVRRPLWIVVDRPAALSALAAGEGRPDPQELLQVPLRHGRAANVTVALGEQLESERLLTEAVLAHTRARVVLGPVPAGQVRGTLGELPQTTPVNELPPGRGYARLGTGPVHRLQVPATPDPYDEGAPEPHRRAVADLLPPWPPTERLAAPAAHPPSRPPEPYAEGTGADPAADAAGTPGRPPTDGTGTHPGGWAHASTPRNASTHYPANAPGPLFTNGPAPGAEAPSRNDAAAYLPPDGRGHAPATGGAPPQAAGGHPVGGPDPEGPRFAGTRAEAPPRASACPSADGPYDRSRAFGSAASSAPPEAAGRYPADAPGTRLPDDPTPGAGASQTSAYPAADGTAAGPDGWGRAPANGAYPAAPDASGRYPADGSGRYAMDPSSPEYAMDPPSPESARHAGHPPVDGFGPYAASPPVHDGARRADGHAGSPGHRRADGMGHAPTADASAGFPPAGSGGDGTWDAGRRQDAPSGPRADRPGHFPVDPSLHGGSRRAGHRQEADGSGRHTADPSVRTSTGRHASPAAPTAYAPAHVYPVGGQDPYRAGAQGDFTADPANPAGPAALSGHERARRVGRHGSAAGHQAGGLGEPGHRLVGDRPGDGERQPYVPFEGAVHPEPRTGRHAYPQPFADLGDPRAGQSPGAYPQGEAALRDGELPVGQPRFERRDDRVPAVEHFGAAGGDGLLPTAGVQQPGDGELFQYGGAQVGIGAGRDQAADHFGGGAYPADPQPGPERLAGGAHGDHRAAGRVEGADGAGHGQPGFQGEVGHGLVGDQYGAGGPRRLDEFAPLGLGGEGAGGVVEVGDHVGQPGGGVPQDLAPGGQVPAAEPVGHADGYEPGPGLTQQLKDIGVRR